MNKILEIFKTLDRQSSKFNTYFDVYERHLSKFVDKSPKILEIGILEGGSIELWLKYFGKGTSVVGLDIHKKDFKYDGDVTFETGDQGNSEFWDKFLSRHTGFDIVIDDGGHTMNQQNTTLTKVYPHLNDGGVFVVEDTHTSYSSTWGGGFDNPKTLQNRSKQLTDIVNKEHIGENLIPKGNLDTFQDLYSVSFYNSLVVFEKKKTTFVNITSR